MYFVSGAAGHLGRAVINHLLTTNKIPAKDIIAGTRDVAKLDDLKAKGVQVRKADFDDEAGLEKALAGVTRFLIISTDALDKPGRRLEQHLRAVKAAEKAGVKHVVYTSMPRPDTSAVLFAPDHLGTEKAIAAAKLEGYTILRNNWYFENLFHSMPAALKSGAHYSAAGKGKQANIGRDDLARGAAAALASAKGGKQTLTLSGPKQYTVAELVDLVSKAAGKPVNVVEVPVEGLVQGLIGAGFPEPVARVFASFDTNIAQGGLEGDSKDFKALTGVEPQSFEDWLKKNAAAFTA
jgi:NAD(P)H dehydrogenase (quinone)